MARKARTIASRKRVPELTLRSPEATSLARTQGFNKVSASTFFALFG